MAYKQNSTVYRFLFSTSHSLPINSSTQDELWNYTHRSRSHGSLLLCGLANKTSVNTFHVIRFSDLTDLWVIKIKKSMILCARSMSTSSEQISQREHAKRFFFNSISKVTRLYDYQTWPTFLGKFKGAQRFVGFFSWLCFPDADWPGRKTLITWLFQFNFCVLQVKQWIISTDSGCMLNTVELF